MMTYKSVILAKFLKSESRVRGLYLITNDDPIQLLLEKLDAALATRQIAILQYRRKK